MRNVYHSLGHLYTGSPVGGTVWGGLWAVALLWGECHWKWTLRVFKDACHLEFAPLLSTCVWRCEFSPSVPGIAAVFCYRVFLPWWNPSSGMIRPNKLSLLLLVLVLMFYPSNKKITNVGLHCSLPSLSQSYNGLLELSGRDSPTIHCLASAAIWNQRERIHNLFLPASLMIL